MAGARGSRLTQIRLHDAGQAMRRRKEDFVRTIGLLCVALLFMACQTSVAGDPPAHPPAQSGATPETAIEIKASSSADGVPAEYAWIERNLPGAKIERQALILDNGKPYDRFDVVLPSGESRAVYFDISSFFGRRP